MQRYTNRIMNLVYSSHVVTCDILLILSQDSKNKGTLANDHDRHMRDPQIIHEVYMLFLIVKVQRAFVDFGCTGNSDQWWLESK
jgi:hypothetical protein